ncbi:tyrosine-type recombinase/integrase [Alienimonas californiensis]|nr:site-specific integrase [Alienimonas californiensis]
MSWQPTGRDAAGRWVKRYKKRRFQSAVAPCRSDREAERAAWEGFIAFRTAVDAESAAAGEDGPPRGYRLALEFHDGVADWCATELRLLDQTGEVPDLEFLGPDGEPREPDDWRAYLEAHRENACAAAAELRRIAAKRNPRALTDEETFPFLAHLAVELPADWDAQVAAGTAVPPPLPSDPAAEDARRWLDRLLAAAEEKRRTVPAAPADRRVAPLIDRYQAGREVKPSTLSRDAERLAHFAAFAGDRDAAALDAGTLEDYRARLLEFCKAATQGGRGWSRAEARQTLNAAKSFVRWLYRTEVLDREPRNLSSCKVEAPRSEPKTEDPALLRRVVDACGDRPVGVWTLLAANVGAYGSDLGGVRLSEIDLEKGVLTRGRTKTGSPGRWRLWDETLERLIAYLEVRPEPREPAFAGLLFLDGRGGPVWRFTEGGQKVDSTRSALKRLRKRMATECAVPSLPMWRRTSATLLRSGPFADVRDVWLAHAPKNVADRSYAAAPLDRVAEACGWLGDQYGFPTDPARLESTATPPPPR